MAALHGEGEGNGFGACIGERVRQHRVDRVVIHLDVAKEFVMLLLACRQIECAEGQPFLRRLGLDACAVQVVIVCEGPMQRDLAGLVDACAQLERFLDRQQRRLRCRVGVVSADIFSADIFSAVIVSTWIARRLRLRGTGKKGQGDEAGKQRAHGAKLRIDRGDAIRTAFGPHRLHDVHCVSASTHCK